jgi:hypothetical protein
MEFDLLDSVGRNLLKLSSTPNKEIPTTFALTVNMHMVQRFSAEAIKKMQILSFDGGIIVYDDLCILSIDTAPIL